MHNWIVVTAQWMLVLECVSVILFVIVNYSIRISHYLADKRKPYIEDNIKAIFFKCIKSKKQPSLLNRIYLEKNINILLDVMESFHVSGEYFKEWISLKKEIYETIFYPMAKHLRKSWRPYKRYYTARCFLLKYDEKDVDLVKKLISDPVLLVSLNASRIAFRYQSTALINTSIDVFSKYRKLRQSIYSTIVRECPSSVEKIVVDRLIKEKDPYVKAFCYQLLQQLPTTERFDDELQADLNAKTMELRLAALHYCGCNSAYYPFLEKYIDDEQWQMRAIAADRIGRIHYIPAADALGKRLGDHEWWVRLRAAEALGKLGERGVSVLKSQTLDKDKFAYEAAQQVLSTLAEGDTAS